MKILVSACLTGENCKYDGGNNRNAQVLKLMEEHEVITVCPEVMGGLPTPRIPSEIRDGIVTAADGRIVDAQFRAGAEKCLEIARAEQPDLVIFQSRSPSCGVKQRYDGTFTGRLVDLPGVTAQLLMENGFRVIDVENLTESFEASIRETLGDSLGTSIGAPFEASIRETLGDSLGTSIEKSPPMESFQIRKTRPEDIERLMEIFEIARAFMRQTGNPNQWGRSGYPQEEQIRKDIAEGHSYVCEHRGSIVGTFFFCYGEHVEPTYEVIDNGSWLEDSAYGVIHRIAVDHTVKGTGTFCINWGLSQYPHMRIDTHEDNRVMRNLLKKLGFQKRGIIYIRNHEPRIAYEKVEYKGEQDEKTVDRH